MLFTTGVSSYADIYVENENAVNADRLSDQEKAQRDMKIGKFLMGGKMLLATQLGITMKKNTKDVLDGVSEMVSESAEFANVTLPTAAHVSIAPEISSDFDKKSANATSGLNETDSAGDTSNSSNGT